MFWKLRNDIRLRWRKATLRPYAWFHRIIITPMRLRRAGRAKHRRLEIGPGSSRISGFETANIVPERSVDYVLDAAKRLPFEDNTFELVYASHVLEHIAWYKVEQVLGEWTRIVSSGGFLEVWVPDALRICKALVDYELTGEDRTDLDGFSKFDAKKDPCRWASARTFTYGDGTGRVNHWNWHRAMFTFRYLKTLMEGVGLRHVERLKPEDVRADTHGWINLGVKGKKP